MGSILYREEEALYTKLQFLKFSVYQKMIVMIQFYNNIQNKHPNMSKIRKLTYLIYFLS